MLEALLLGAIQGLSEFLPISSSGHLALAMRLINWQDPPLVMSLVVHLGTLLAVFALYWRDIFGAIGGGARLLIALPGGRERISALLREDEHAGLALWVIIATIPTGLVAILIKSFVEDAAESPQVVGVLLTACGGLLLASRWIPQKELKLTWWRAALIGVAQGLAVFPGISRSGTTIVVGLALGLKRDEAAKFSFIASIPAIVGASILEIDPEVIAASPSGMWSYLIAGVTSLVVGYGALRLLVGLVRRGGLWWFALYMLPVGILAFLFIR